MSAIVPETAQEHPAWWREHCLRGCEGFLVEDAEGTVGFVERVVCEDDRPVALVLQSCRPRSGAQHLCVRIEDVADVRPEVERVSLRARAQPPDDT